jgi:hypothetical protein
MSGDFSSPISRNRMALSTSLPVSFEDDLRVIAEHGYEGAASAIRATVAKGIAHATAGGPFAVMESSEASLALIARTEVADRRNATCHDGRA